MIIPIWQKLLSVLLYLLPWSDGISFGRYLFSDFPILQWLALPALPILLIEQSLPFGNLILFFVLFLAIIRNPQTPYFLKFNTLQAILIDIAIILINYANQILLKPLGEGLIIRTLSSTILLGILTLVTFAIYECLQGRKPEIPGISEAVKMQL